MGMYERLAAPAFFNPGAEQQQKRNIRIVRRGIEVMINYHTELVDTLNNILPTYYELTLTTGTQTPCISYMERNNYVVANGNTLGYSKV